MRHLMQLVDSLRADLIAAGRGLSFRPAYVAIATVTLALGIGSATVVFTIVDAMAFQPMPFREPDRLVMLWERSLQDPEIDRWPVSPATYRDWRTMTRSYEDLAAYDYRSPVFADDSSVERLSGLLVEGNLFELLGAVPLDGRTIVPADADNDARVAVISHGLWTRAFGRDPSALGRDLVLDGVATTIVGIMPPDFRFPFEETIDVWRPLRMGPDRANDRSTSTLFVVGRLRDGVRIEAARQEADRVAAELADRYPETQENRGINLITLRDHGLEWRLPMLRVFAVAVALTLAVACLNFAGLLLARALSRSRELAVRMALGAGHRRVAQVLVIEALVIAAIGGAAGAGLAALLLPLFQRIAPQGWSGPQLAGASIDGRALAFVMVLATATAVLASLAPLLRLPRLRLAGIMQGGARTAGGREQLRLRRVLVVAQVTLALVLLGEAGRLSRSVYNTFALDVGFEADGVLSARVPTDPERADKPLFYRTLAERAAALPGVEAVALANIVPLSGGGMPVAVTTDGSSPSAALSADGYNREVQFRMVGREFFELLGIPLVSGRNFTEGDVAGGERVALVNERFVRMFFEGNSPLDASIRAALYFQDNPEGFDRPWRIVGVVGDVAEWGVWMQPPIIYVPYPQAQPRGSMSLLLRTAVPPESLVEELEATVWELGGRMPLENAQPLERFYSTRLYAMHGFILSLFLFFAGAAALLTAVGVYGVIAYQVRRRRREISIRIALGAHGRDVLGAVLREGIAMSLLGGLLGLLIALAAGRFVSTSYLTNFLYEVGWFDPASFVLAAVLMLVTVVLASLGPARQAARVDPAGALKEDA